MSLQPKTNTQRHALVHSIRERIAVVHGCADSHEALIFANVINNIFLTAAGSIFQNSKIILNFVPFFFLRVFSNILDI